MIFSIYLSAGLAYLRSVLVESQQISFIWKVVWLWLYRSLIEVILFVEFGIILLAIGQQIFQFIVRTGFSKVSLSSENYISRLLQLFWQQLDLSLPKRLWQAGSISRLLSIDLANFLFILSTDFS